MPLARYAISAQTFLSKLLTRRTSVLRQDQAAPGTLDGCSADLRLVRATRSAQGVSPDRVPHQTVSHIMPGTMGRSKARETCAWHRATAVEHLECVSMRGDESLDQADCRLRVVYLGVASDGKLVMVRAYAAAVARQLAGKPRVGIHSVLGRRQISLPDGPSATS